MDFLGNCHWSVLDKLSQKAAGLAPVLGTLTEYTHLIAPIMVVTYPLQLLSSPIQRMVYMIISAVVLQIVWNIEDGSKKCWVEKQVKRICEQSASNVTTRKVLYIGSSYQGSEDYCAFFKFKTKSDITRLAKDSMVHFIEAQNERQVKEEITKLDNQSFDAVIIQAHGGKDVIQLSKEYSVRMSSLEFFDILAPKIKQKGKLSLISCLTGSGTENIAQAISKICKESTVFAPSGIYKLGDFESVTINDTGACSFKRGNCITALWQTREDMTIMYQDGIKLTT